MSPSTSEYVKKILESEALLRTKAIEEINEKSRFAEAEAVKKFTQPGIFQSGNLARKVISIHRNRAKEIANRLIALRGEFVRKCPALATPDAFAALAESVTVLAQRENED
jgi:hypothetical protein